MQEISLSDVRQSDAAERLLKLDGHPYSLREYPMFVDIFNTPLPRKVMRSGRQVSKTITMAADMVTTAALNPFKPLLYANASEKQTSSFSTSKLDPFLLHSPAIYNVLMKSKRVINNVYTKRFANSSNIYMTYFSETADRIRGNSGHNLYLDEIQDMNYDAVIDAERCLDAHKKPLFTYAGTSKSTISTLEYLWELSTRKEWIIKCDSCGKWNIPSKENIFEFGFACKKCQTRLNTFKGRWHSFAKEGEHYIYDGYHIPQVIMPLHCNDPDKWAILFHHFQTMPSYKFDNEIMGIPVGEGDVPITEGLLKSICIDTLPMYGNICPENAKGASHILAGADWGGSGVTGVSKTVLSIYACYAEQNKIVKIFGRIYESGEPTKHLQDIAQCLRSFNATVLYGDHGNGNFAMSQLASMVPHISIIPVMYTEQAKPFRWDEQARRFTVNRTTLIDKFILDMKHGKIQAFNWNEFKPFASDILNIREEYIGESKGITRRVWRKHPTKSDDSLHSMVFGWFAAKVAFGDLDFGAYT